jgi:hypothetical protein
MQCLSCKNKNSFERCKTKSLQGLNFCGIHARSKNKNLWTSMHNLEKPLTRFQAIYRGWLIRDTLKLSGPGVFKKSIRHNEEDLVTADQVLPTDYFGILENGKVFWFDIRTIYQWSFQNIEPTNPYTKQLLSIDDRNRLRRLVARREFFGRKSTHDPDFFKTHDIVRFLVIQLVQVLNENLFVEMPESYFSELNEFQLVEFSKKITYASRDWRNSKHPLYNKYYTWLEATYRLIQSDFLRGLIPFLLTTVAILRNRKIQYDFSFKLMSARSNLI